MAKVLGDNFTIRRRGKATAIVTTILRPRGNTESIISVEAIKGSEDEVKKKLLEFVKKIHADKKVIITVMTGLGVATTVYDCSE